MESSLLPVPVVVECTFTDATGVVRTGSIRHLSNRSVLYPSSSGCQVGINLPDFWSRTVMAVYIDLPLPASPQGMVWVTAVCEADRRVRQVDRDGAFAIHCHESDAMRLCIPWHCVVFEDLAVMQLRVGTKRSREDARERYS